MADYSVIDAVCNIWTPEALSHRPGWTDEFFVGKVKGKHDSAGITLETMIEGMDGVRQLETAVKDFGFIGAHLYPHWFELPPNHAKYYPFYAKCIELDIPVQMQVGQSLIYAKEPVGVLLHGAGYHLKRHVVATG